jgi:hypothetical protein
MYRRLLPRVLLSLLVQPTLTEPVFTGELCHRGLLLAARGHVYPSLVVEFQAGPCRSSGVMNPAALIVVEPLEGSCGRLCSPPGMCAARHGGCCEATTAEARGTALVERMFPDKSTLAPRRCGVCRYSRQCLRARISSTRPQTGNGSVWENEVVHQFDLARRHESSASHAANAARPSTTTFAATSTQPW